MTEGRRKMADALFLNLCFMLVGDHGVVFARGRVYAVSLRRGHVISWWLYGRSDPVVCRFALREFVCGCVWALADYISSMQRLPCQHGLDGGGVVMAIWFYHSAYRRHAALSLVRKCRGLCLAVLLACCFLVALPYVSDSCSSLFCDFVEAFSELDACVRVFVHVCRRVWACVCVGV